MQTDLQYELQGDYYVIAGESEDERPPVGIWGQRHLQWLKQNRRVTYTNLLTAGRQNAYLRNIDTLAYEQLELLIQQMAEAEGVTERLKAENQMKWVRQMSSIRARAEAVINSELIWC